MNEVSRSARDIAIEDIDSVLSYATGISGSEAVYEMAIVLQACVERWAPPGSVYRSAAAERPERQSHLALPARAALKALRRDIAAGAVHRFEELINAGVLADIVEQGEHLLDSGYSQAAVVLFGGALEEHVRKLAQLQSIPLVNGHGAPQKASFLNDQLGTSGMYTAADRDLVAAWLKIRNFAAHNQPELSQYTAAEFRMMAQGVRSLIARYPA